METEKMIGQSASRAVEPADQGFGEMVAKEPIGLRIPKEVRAALEKLAKADDRSVSYIINKILAEYLRARKLIK
jgi:hypothetical protein